MNIFFFNKDVKINSILLDDKRLVKMILETTQLLSNALYLSGLEAPYKPTHLKHPCTSWAARSIKNWKWLKSYGIALAKEYTIRFKKIHKCEEIINEMVCPKIKDIGFTKPEQCMPEKYRCEDSCEAYVNYYLGEKFNYLYFKRCSKKTQNFWEEKYIKNLNIPCISS